MAIVTGENAFYYLSTQNSGYGGNEGGTYGFSDFSLTVDRDVTEQELTGKKGNQFFYGALSVDGSFTACKFAASGTADSLYSILESELVKVSGGVDTGGDADLNWNFTSGQVTGYDVSVGDSSTISEADIDFTVLDPANVSFSAGTISD